MNEWVSQWLKGKCSKSLLTKQKQFDIQWYQIYPTVKDPDTVLFKHPEEYAWTFRVAFDPNISNQNHPRPFQIHDQKAQLIKNKTEKNP